MPFIFNRLDIEGVVLIEPKVFSDERGFFTETYKRSDFAAAGLDFEFIQDNHSKSVKGVLRGLHYQLSPFAQGKLVRCIQGEILDVAVDIRKDSPTFGKWSAEKLSADNKRMLYIPVGFAHGFLVLSDTAEIVYKVHGGEYAPQYDRGIMWNDPELAIDWGVADVIVSDKDTKHPLFRDAEVF
ncbi:dTDP-4-dehydrorhamnose 3,5-epimerase [Seleniivibrio woodruffii]|uniref:dTDP-4-dehydrorhamnose 3,5-epimerase n=1 Tax=Seleniivibrio woodruffii TaxID=1078050 RepID=A0A4R1KCK7_9BACT|nr:dTDP-4-dehydrorhamnose 3,5-epimerase [Seleniivibrio woodruffii]TCK62338.1 dTDP-4-dehydrorhamnose 3,5-epimerase [Seleniivibrio woodruffii]TVZ34545.1 dTDP-4-dehydrorhamnose 3,5-epimerase [Seleniivibrio woodruffii]